MVGHGGSSAGSYLADPISPIPSHCASIVVTSTLRVNHVCPCQQRHTPWLSRWELESGATYRCMCILCHIQTKITTFVSFRHRCGCGRVLTKHCYLRAPANKDPRSSSADEKWNPALHTESSPTDAYGTIEFQGGPHPTKAQVRLKKIRHLFTWFRRSQRTHFADLDFNTVYY